MENKWWEYYAVRYFVGTVIGAVVIAYLNTESGSPFAGRMTIVGESKEATFLGVGLVAALGFAFCYVASAPVLVLHTARAHLRISAMKASATRCFITLVASAFATTAAVWQFLPPSAAVVSGLVVGLQLGLLLMAVSTKFKVIETFYRELANNRAKVMPEKDKPATPGVEYVTSYRHLREHGNAFLIVLLEGLLAYVLVLSPSFACASVVLAFWILPASAVWLVGTVLESRFVSQPLP